MDIYVQSTPMECAEFRPKQKEPVTVVISPLRIEGIEGDERKLKVVTGCNHWEACQNPNCYFSSAARKNKTS